MEFYWGRMITFAKSSPGSGKNLKWLPEMAFQGF